MREAKSDESGHQSNGESVDRGGLPSTASSTARDVAATAFGVETLAFRAGRLARLTAEAGWLTMVGRFPLELGDNQLPIGVASLDAHGGVRLSVSPGLLVTCNGQALAANDPRPLRSDSDAGGPDPIVHGRLIYELIRRGQLLALRVRDPQSPLRRQFRGTEWFPVRPDWCLPGRYEPFAEEKLISIPYDVGAVLSRSPGQVALDLFGRTWRLDVLMDDERKRLFILFGDTTNRDQTYGAGRFLYTAGLPDLATGGVIVDLNRALNPACAFTEFVSCPLPPPQNRFPFAVEAGEKRYLDH